MVRLCVLLLYTMNVIQMAITYMISTEWPTKNRPAVS